VHHDATVEFIQTIRIATNFYFSRGHGQNNIETVNTGYSYDHITLEDMLAQDIEVDVAGELLSTVGAIVKATA
jgi:hypothetical protein